MPELPPPANFRPFDFTAENDVSFGSQLGAVLRSGPAGRQAPKRSRARPLEISSFRLQMGRTLEFPKVAHIWPRARFGAEKV